MPTRVLIVDDSSTESLRARLILEREGFQVSLAPDGKAGLAKAAEEMPDLIFLDSIMKVNGFETCGKLKLDPKTRGIPVVMLPTVEEIADMPSGPGLDCFLPKPYEPHLLVSKAKEMTNGHGHLQTAAPSDLASEIQRYQSELDLARQQVEAANRARRDLLANISHELRTPLHEITGMTDLLLGTTLTDEQQTYVNTTKASTNSLLALITDVIEFSEMESGQLELKATPFNLEEPIDRIIEIMGPQAAEKGIKGSTRIMPNVPQQLVGDANRLRQVLANFVSNAIKFTDHGEIAILVAADAVRDQEVELHFTVQDTGIGIAEDRQEMIYEPFQQADSSATRRYGGMGMGLAMSRQLAKTMGGRIWFESEVGKGTTFHFTAKLARQARSAPAAVVSPAAPSWPRPLQILVAEDSPTNQLIAKASLKKNGHTVTLAVNGREAVQAYEKSTSTPGETKFDLVLMDVAMPEMDGLDATRAIREREKALGGHIIIVAMTAFATKEYHEKCLAAGMDAYVTKPVRIDELDKTLAPLMTEPPKLALPPTAVPHANASLPPPVDLTEALESVGGDVDIMLEAIAMVLEEVPPQQQSLQEAMAGQDPKGVEAKAHRIKGVMGNIGGLAARDIAQKLETMGEQGDLVGGTALVDSLAKEIERVIAFYRDPAWEQRARALQGDNDG